MSAGQPDWAKLAELGKLPENQKEKVPHLQQAQQFEKLIAELENKVEVAVSCLTAKGKEKFFALLAGKDVEEEEIKN